MPIPKAILHPALLLAGMGLVLALVWTKIPDATDAAAPATPTRNRFPDPRGLSVIEDVDDNGSLVIAGFQTHWKLDADALRAPGKQEITRLREFLKDKRLSLSGSVSGVIQLPVELYDPLCFIPEKSATVRCPVVLEP